MWSIKFIVGNLRKLNNEILFLEKYLEFSEMPSPENVSLYGRQDSILGMCISLFTSLHHVKSNLSASFCAEMRQINHQ